MGCFANTYSCYRCPCLWVACFHSRHSTQFIWSSTCHHKICLSFHSSERSFNHPRDVLLLSTAVHPHSPRKEPRSLEEGEICREERENRIHLQPYSVRYCLSGWNDGDYLSRHSCSRFQCLPTTVRKGRNMGDVTCTFPLCFMFTLDGFRSWIVCIFKRSCCVSTK
jgi:hypothetical protein